MRLRKFSIIGRRFGLVAAAMLSAAVLTGCAKTQQINGYVLDQERLARLAPGRQSREDVRQLLGSPSTLTTFKERQDTWYYISQRREKTAFAAAKLIDQQVVAINFDANGRVADVRRYTLDDSREIELVDRETPTRGRELGFVEQLFGNIGRFNETPEAPVLGRPN